MAKKATAEKGPLSMKDAAEKILERNGKPLKSKTITDLAVKEKMIKTTGRTPDATMAAQLATEVKGGSDRFVRTSPGTFGLKGRDRKGQKEELTLA